MADNALAITKLDFPGVQDTKVQCVGPLFRQLPWAVQMLSQMHQLKNLHDISSAVAPLNTTRPPSLFSLRLMYSRRVSTVVMKLQYNTAMPYCSQRA
jgi:hypothetical protein